MKVVTTIQPILQQRNFNPGLNHLSLNEGGHNKFWDIGDNDGESQSPFTE